MSLTLDTKTFFFFQSALIVLSNYCVLASQKMQIAAASYSRMKLSILQ